MSPACAAVIGGVVYRGEAVLITQGSVAAGYFTGKTAPVDALIIGSIDEETSKTKSRK